MSLNVDIAVTVREESMLGLLVLILAKAFEANSSGVSMELDVLAH